MQDKISPESSGSEIFSPSGLSVNLGLRHHGQTEIRHAPEDLLLDRNSLVFQPCHKTNSCRTESPALHGDAATSLDDCMNVLSRHCCAVASDSAGYRT